MVKAGAARGGIPAALRASFWSFIASAACATGACTGALAIGWVLAPPRPTKAAKFLPMGRSPRPPAAGEGAALEGGGCATAEEGAGAETGAPGFGGGVVPSARFPTAVCCMAAKFFPLGRPAPAPEGALGPEEAAGAGADAAAAAAIGEGPAWSGVVC